MGCKMCNNCKIAPHFLYCIINHPDSIRQIEYDLLCEVARQMPRHSFFAKTCRKILPWRHGILLPAELGCKKFGGPLVGGRAGMLAGAVFTGLRQQQKITVEIPGLGPVSRDSLTDGFSGGLSAQAVGPQNAGAGVVPAHPPAEVRHRLSDGRSRCTGGSPTALTASSTLPPAPTTATPSTRTPRTWLPPRPSCSSWLRSPALPSSRAASPC